MNDRQAQLRMWEWLVQIVNICKLTHSPVPKAIDCTKPSTVKNSSQALRHNSQFPYFQGNDRQAGDVEIYTDRFTLELTKSQIRAISNTKELTQLWIRSVIKCSHWQIHFRNRIQRRKRPFSKTPQLLE